MSAAFVKVARLQEIPMEKGISYGAQEKLDELIELL